MEPTQTQRQLVKRTYVMMALFVLAIVVICGLSAFLIGDAIQGDRREPSAVAEGVIVETFVELDGDRAYPEALTAGPDGNLYSGSFCTGQLWQVSPSGEITSFVDEDGGINSASGMAFAPDGSLFVIDHGDCNPRNSDSTIKRVTMAGEVTEYADLGSDILLNGLAFDGQGRLLVTDSQAGEILLIDADGNSEVWWELSDEGADPLPTGMVYDVERNAMLVADSNNGIIYQLEILEDGSVGEVTIRYQDDDHELDGLTLDSDGNIIFTIYNLAQVARLDGERQIDILAEDFRDPSDVAVLNGDIYVTNFDSLSLAPILSILVEPSLPFTIDVIRMGDGTVSAES